MRVRNPMVNAQDFDAIVVRLAALEIKVSELSQAPKAGRPAKEKANDPS
jgi:uncharacterized protein HemX